MNAVQILTLTMLLAAGGGAQLFKSGKCPDPAVQYNFDPARYLGKWFEIQKLPSAFQKGQCATSDYILQSPRVVRVLNRELLDDGTVRSAFGTVEVKDPAEPAKLEVTFSDVILLRGSYWLLSTDYDSYALVYSCKSYGLFHVELAWILSRQPTLPKDITEYLLSILSSIGVSVDKMVSTIQDEAYCSPMYQ
ncbi:apolipoprotein D-like isoform X1 [Poecilia latipinna]|nr:PREDICTED: apolipoprotein D-like isoform X1 [Poecilia formosa]XP_014887473.1 PREDICTED: apolipoprotein D-like isoform X1 [Poecilia latipinna]